MYQSSAVQDKNKRGTEKLCFDTDYICKDAFDFVISKPIE